MASLKPNFAFGDENVAKITSNLGQALFGDPNQAGTTLYRKAEADKANAETRGIQDQQAAKGQLADIFRGLGSAPPEGVDRATYTRQLIAAAAPVFARATGGKGSLGDLAQLFGGLSQDPDTMRAGMVAGGHAITSDFAPTGAEGDRISARDAGQKLTQANSVAGIAAAAQRYGDDTRLTGVKYGVDNAPVHVSQDSTVLVPPSNASAPQAPGGVATGQRSLEGVKADALAAQPMATRLASIFKPHNMTPGAITAFAPGDPLATGPQISGTPTPKGQRLVKMSEKDLAGVEGRLAEAMGVDGDTLGKSLSQLTPEEYDAYSNAMNEAWNSSGGSIPEAVSAGRAVLQKALTPQQPSMLGGLFHGPSLVRNPSSAAPPPSAPGAPGAAPGGLPGVGPMAGQLSLNPAIAPVVPQGAARPFAPGEYITNPSGSWSSEISTTIGPGERPDLNGGKPTVIPTLWIINGKAVRVSEDQAADLAVKSGLNFRSFSTPDEAEKFSIDRENGWQSLRPQDAGRVAPLWTPPGAPGATPAAIAAPAARVVGQTYPTPKGDLVWTGTGWVPPQQWAAGRS